MVRLLKRIPLFFGIFIIVNILTSSNAEAATSIYRSAAPTATSALSTSTASNITLSISGDTATFSGAQPDNIGVGDVIQYDSDNNGSIDSLAFIHGRTSSTAYTVKNAAGSSATSTSAADTDWSIFRAYSSIANAEAGIENTGITSTLRNFDDWTAGGTAATDDIGKDLVTADQQWNIALYANNGIADAYARIDGWTASSTQYIRVYTPYLSSEVGVSQRHNGKWDSTKYKIEGISTGFEIREDYTRFDGVQIQVTQPTDVSTSGLVLSSGFTSGASTFISNNIIVGTNLNIATSLHRGMNINTTGHNFYSWNNVIYGFNVNTNGYGIYKTNGNLYVYNTLAADNYNGIRGATVCKNCVSFRNTGSDFPSSAGIDRSASDDGAGTNAVVPTDWSTVFVDILNHDYHLRSTDTSLINHGANPSDANAPFTTDIDGETRFDGSWDIGPDEYIAGPDTTAPNIFSIASSTTATTATIDWTTNEAASSTVNYGVTTSYGSASTSNAFVTSRSIVLTGLTPSTLYNFKVSSSDVSGNISSSTNYTFTTEALDVTVPVITSIASSTTLTTATITWATNESATSTVNYGLTTSYGNASTSATLTTSHSIVLTGLTSNTAYHFKVSSSDPTGNLATSTDYVFTTPASDIVAPIISAVASSTSFSAATITWNTNEAATSQIQYGLTTSYGSQTSLDSSLITSHSVNLSGLSASTTYHYRIISADAANNVSTSTDYTFTTLPQPPKAWSYPAVPYTDWEYDPFTYPAPATPTEWPSAAKVNYYYIAPDDVNATDTVSGGEPVDANGKRFGYPNKPRKTLPLISKNFNVFPAGTVFWMKGGSYNQVYGTGEDFSLSSQSTANNPFRIYGDPNDKPVFHNTRIALYNSTYGFIENIIWDDSTRGGSSVSFGRNDAEGDTHHITVRNVSVQNRSYITNSGHFAVATAGSGIVNGDIHDIVFYKINFKNNGGGIDWDAVDADMHGYKLNGIWNENRTYRIWIIENEVHKGDTPDPIDGFYKSLAGNFVQVGDQKVTEGNVDHVWIAGNYGEGMRQGCAGAKRSGHVVVSSNICKDLAQTDTSQGQAYNIKYDRQENLWFVNNYVENVDAFIIRAESTSSGAGGPDTFNKLDTRVYIIGNVFKDNMREPWNAPDMGGIGGWKTKGISIQDMNGKVYIANNVIDTSVYGVYFDPHGNRQSVGSEMHVYNNIAINLSAGLDTSTAANNGIMITTKTDTEWFIENNFVENGRYYFSGTQYNSAADFNARANAQGNMQGDPMFTNPAADDYTLLPGSPAIDAGILSYTTNSSPDIGQLFINAFSNDPDFPGNPADVWPLDIAKNQRISGSNIDMGAYEFQQSEGSDTTPPSISSVASSTTATTATISWNTNEAATSTVNYGLTTSYGSASSSNAFATTRSIVLTGLTPSTLYNFKLSSTDTSGNLASTTNYTFTTAAPDAVPPVISSIASSTTQTTATISWNTSEVASSTVDYGLTTSYGSASSSAALVTSRSIVLSGLTANTLYHFRITARDSIGNLATSSDLTFTTASLPVSIPTLTVEAAGSVATSTATLNGTIVSNNNGSSTVRGFEYGLTTSYGQTVSTNGTYNTGAYSIPVTGLLPGTLYHYRAFATNGAGTGVSTDNTFTTDYVPDTTAPVISSIASSTAQTTATISWFTDEIASSTVEYGLTTSYGSASSSDVFTTSRSMVLSGLTADTLYHFRISSRDAAGNLSTSTDLTFRTTAIVVSIPTVTVQSATSVGESTATFNGTIVSNNNGSSTVRGFEYGVTTSYGQSTSTIGTYDTGAYTISITGLTPGTLYHYRAFATNGAGTGVSSDGTFTTTAAPSSGGGGGGGGSSGGSYTILYPTATTTTTTGGATSTPMIAETICPQGHVFSTTTGKKCTSWTTTATTPAAGYFFTRNLTIGATGADVRALQIFLNSNGFTVSTSGVGSSGNESTYFGGATRSALAKFQAAKGITPAAGYFGPATRAVVNGTASAPTATTPTITPPTSIGISLKLGSSGEAVKLMRTKLRALGYFAPYGSASDVPASASVETDYFGSTTEAALRKFQCEKGIVCEGNAATTGWGVLGPKTRTILEI